MEPTQAGPPEFGLFVTNQQPIGTDPVAALQEQLTLVRAARDGGWSSLFTGQHFLTDAMTMLQPAPFLARVASEAGDMRIGIGILLLALQNPVDIAETWASVDAVCEGRLVFGVGLGYREPEFAAFGLSRSEAVTRFEHNLAIVKRLWEGESLTLDLPWCHLRDARLSLRPVQRPRPPIWVAANSDGAVRRAARIGDAWIINPHASRQTVTRQMDLYRAERVAHGLATPEVVPLFREVFCAPTREAAFGRSRPHLELKYGAYAAWGQDRVLPGSDSFQVPFDDLAPDRFVIGSPDDCAEQLLAWRQTIGVTHFLVRTDWVGMPLEWSLESIDLLTREVIPAVVAG